METRIDEIADGIYRLSTFFPEVVPPAGFTFNQFLVLADEPLLFHCGLRAMFPSSLAAVAKLLPVERLRWITFGHFEADECGSMNDWLAVAPQAQVAHGALACDLSLIDHGRPAAARAGRRRGARPRRQAGPLPRHPACPARLGRRRGARGNDRDPALRRPVRPCRQRPGGDRSGDIVGPATRGRGDVPVHQPRPDHRAHDPQARRPGAADAGADARLVVRGDAAGAVRSLADWYDERLRRAMARGRETSQALAGREAGRNDAKGSAWPQDPPWQACRNRSLPPGYRAPGWWVGKFPAGPRNTKPVSLFGSCSNLRPASRPHLGGSLIEHRTCCRAEQSRNPCVGGHAFAVTCRNLVGHVGVGRGW